MLWAWSGYLGYNIELVVRHKDQEAMQQLVEEKLRGEP